MSNDTPRTLWSLLADHQLVIPIIQRDYAQGREDERSGQIRRNFVDAIKAAIGGTDAKPLDLGLVYGDLTNGHLIMADPAWDELFADAENHAYFQGQIGFLIEMSRDKEDKQESMQGFQRYLEVAKRIFAKGGLIDHKEFLVQRALLTFGDYLPSVGNNNYNFSFGQDEDQWRRLVFRDEEKRELLQTLFTILSSNTTASGDEDRLRGLISKSNAGDWRKHFIECPAAIEACHRRIIRFFHDQHILLLQTSQTNGYHAELRSYCFYVRHIEPADSAFASCQRDYCKQKSVSLPCYAYLVDPESKYRIELRYLTETGAVEPYEITFMRNDNKAVPDDIMNKCNSSRLDAAQTRDGVGPACVSRFKSEDPALMGLKRIVAAIRSPLNPEGLANV